MPLTVSVIIATYNYGRFLTGAIDSVLAQTFTDWEAIVVDDGSTDNTSEVIKPYLSDQRIQYHRTDHLGAAGSRNVAIRQARGSFLGILDADDLWLPTKLERQMALFRHDPELGVAYARRFNADEDGRILGINQCQLHRGHVLPLLFVDNFVCFSSAVIRRETIEDVGLFDVRWALSEDWDLLLRISARYQFDYVDDPLVIYRMRDVSRRAETNYLIMLEIMRRFLDDYGGRWMLDSATIRRSYAETYLHMGQAKVARSRLAAFSWYLRALLTLPTLAETWKELAKLPIPAVGRRMLRSLTRKHVDRT